MKNVARLRDKDDPTYWELLDAIQRQHPAYDLEIRNGEYVVVQPGDLVASSLAINIGCRLERWVEETHMGHVFGSNAGVSYADGDLIAADVTYVSRGRMPVIPRSFARVVPELVFETRSVNQSKRASRAKVELMLDHGIDVVVFIDPGQRVWEVYRGCIEPVVLRDHDRFELPDILPGFSVVVAELWPE